MTPSQLERAWRRLSFERQHHWNALAWARTDLERDARAEQVRRCTWQLVDLSEARKRLQWEDVPVDVALAAARFNREASMELT